MSEILTSLCSAILKERYGETVQTVGKFLLKYMSSCPLNVIVKKVSLPRETVKLSLRVLIQHGFCTFEEEKGIAEYSMKHENVLVLLHYESYASCAQMLCGDLADILVMEVLNNGSVSMSQCLRNVLERLQETNLDASGGGSLNLLQDLRDKFLALVEKHLLIRCPYSHTTTTNDPIPNLSIADQEYFLVPKINLSLIESCVGEEPCPKKQKIEYPDKGLNWKVNHDRYIEYFRNECIIQACSNQLDEKAAEVVKTVLTLSVSNRLSPTTNAVSRQEIFKKIIQAGSMKSQELDSYLCLLCEGKDSFLSKTDESGGMYVVNVAKVLRRLVESLAATVVRDKFGAKCARIFRILLSKKVLEPKQIEELAMLHPKDTKEYIYQMFEDAFIMSHDIPKGSDFSHGQTFYLLRVDLVQVCQMLLERCYQALLNLVTYSNLQNEENKRLLEKKQRIDAIVASLKQNGSDEEQIQEVQNIITPPEEAIIKKIAICSEKIDNGERQIADMLLLLSIWLEFSRCQ